MANLKCHFIDRDSAEKYVVVFTGDAVAPVEVYSLLDGSRKTVNISGQNDGYLATSRPDLVLKALTIGDYTIITNTTKPTAMSGLPESANVYPTAIINVLHGVAGTIYNVLVEGAVVATYTSGDTTQYSTFRTTVIAEALKTALIASLGGDWHIEAMGSAVVLYRYDAEDFTFSVNDSWGDSALVGIKEDAKKLEDLPNILPIFSTTARSTITVGPTSALSAVWSQIPAGNEQGYIEDWLPSDGPVGIHYTFDIDGFSFDEVYASNVPKGQVAEGLAEAIREAFADTPEVIVHCVGTVISIWDTSEEQPLAVTDTCGNFTGVVGTPIFGPYGFVYSPIYQDLLTVTAVEANTTGANSIVVHVAGEVKNPDSPAGYYLKWATENKDGVSTAGVWKETRKQNLDNNLNASTMPHKLVREETGTFTLSPITWDERLIGDEDSAPVPSFIGLPISDAFFHKNRVGFLAGGHVVISRADSYWNFFPTSALEVLDDDPVDITVPSTGVDALRWGIPNKGDLLVFGPADQYLLTAGDQVFGPKSVSMDSNTNFPISAIVSPVRCGANVFFVSPKGDFAAFHEYFTQPQTLTDDAADVAAHAPKYIPSDLRFLTASPVFNLLLMGTGEDDTIYCYKYYWAGDQKAQSAWFKWTLPYTVKAAEIIGNYVYVIGENGEQTVIEKMDLERITTGALPFQVRLDQQEQFDVASSYNSGENWTAWEMDYTLDLSDTFAVVRLDTGQAIAGAAVYDDEGILVVRVSGDYQNTPVIVGKPYEQSFTFSEFGIPAPKGNVFSPQGEIQLRTLTVCYTDTGPFDLTVLPKGRTTPLIQHFVTTPLASGKKRFLVLANSIGAALTLSNSTHRPATWFEASWEGYYTTRNQGI